MFPFDPPENIRKQKRVIQENKTPNKQMLVFFRTRLGKYLIQQKCYVTRESDFIEANKSNRIF